MSEWEDVPADDSWADFTPVQETRGSKLNREMGQMKPRDDRPPGTWNPFVHAGYDIKRISTGAKQMLGMTTPKEEQEMQREIDLMNSRKQPVLAQIAGMGLLAAPSILASPLGVSGMTSMAARGAGAVGAKGLATELGKKKLATRMMANQQRTTIPGLYGAAEGAAYGGVDFVDPNDPNPSMTRMQRAILAGGTGATVDSLGMLGGNILGRKIAQKERQKLSGDLPETVPLNTGDLWDQNRLRSYTDKTMKSQSTGESTAALLESSKRRPVEAVERNAAKIREMATGSGKPTDKGQPLETVLTSYQKMRNREQNDLNDFYTEYAKSDHNVHMLDGELDSIDDAWKTLVKTERPDTSSRQFGRIERIMDSIDTDDGLPVVDMKKLLNAQKDLGNIVENTTGTHQKLASKARRVINDKIDDLVERNALIGNEEELGLFMNQVTKGKEFRAKHDNKILNKMGKDGYSPQDLSDELLGKVEFRSSQKQLDAIDKLQAANPDFNKALKSELYQQTFTGFDRGKKFDIDSFLSQYEKGYLSGRGKPLYDKLLSQGERKQLQDLYNVSDKIQRPLQDVRNLADTGPVTEALTLPVGINTITDFASKKTGLDDYLTAIRNLSGRRYATTATRGSGKMSALANREMEERGTNPLDGVKAWYDYVSKP